jgi:hypothetical protein
LTQGKGALASFSKKKIPSFRNTQKGTVIGSNYKLIDIFPANLQQEEYG